GNVLHRQFPLPLYRKAGGSGGDAAPGHFAARTRGGCGIRRGQNRKSAQLRWQGRLHALAGRVISFMAEITKPLVAVIMGSKSDWEVMRAASDTFSDFGVPHENRVLSAHRTPELAAEFASGAEARGLEVIIAG